MNQAEPACKSRQVNMRIELPIPEYSTAQEWPDSDVWLVRLRNPTLLGQAEYIHPGRLLHCWPGRLILHCWPAYAQDTTSRPKFSRIIAYLATIYPQPVNHWAYQFDGRPPELLMLRAARGDWTGILQSDSGEVWHVLERNPLVLVPGLSPRIVSYFVEYQERSKMKKDAKRINQVAPRL